MGAKVQDVPPVPEALAQARKRVRAAERRGVDVTEAKRLLVRALLAFRARRLEEMGESTRAAVQALSEGEQGHREEGLRRRLWELKEGGGPAVQLSAAEAALSRHALDEAEAALSGMPRTPARRRTDLLPKARVAALTFGSGTFRIAVAEILPGGGARVVDLLGGDASGGDLDGAMSAALRGLRPRPLKVLVGLPPDAHVLSAVPLPSLPASEMADALRWKLAKLCDFPPEEAQVASRRLSSGREPVVLGLMARRDALQRIQGVVAGAGLPLGGILAPGEVLSRLIPPFPPGEARALLEIGRDSSYIYVFGPAGRVFSRDLGVGTALWRSALETPLNSTRGVVNLSAHQAGEVLDRFDVSGSENLQLEDGTVLNDKDLLSLLRPSMERLQVALVRSLEFSARLEGGVPVTGVLLCGEGASLKGLDRVLSAHVKVPVSPMDPGLRLVAVPGGCVPGPGDALACALLTASGDSPAGRSGVLDLAPSSAGVEVLLARAAVPALAAGLLLSALLGGVGAMAHLQEKGLSQKLVDAQGKVADLDTRLAACNTELQAISVPTPSSDSVPATVLRELTLALPPEGAIHGLSLEFPETGGPFLFLDAPAEPDFAPSLSALGKVVREKGEGDGVRYRCAISLPREGRQP